MKEIIISSKTMAGVTCRSCSGVLSFIVLVFVFLLTVPVCYPADVRLAWDANPDPTITGYRIYYGTATGYYTNAVDAGNQTALTITGLLPGVTYYFAATDYSDEGYESYFSSEVSYTVPGASSSTSSGGGGCFIATAAYGSYLAPEVMTLREFRDRYLMTNRIGKSFVAWYYRASPLAADLIASNESLRCVVRLGLTPIVYAVNYPMAAFLIVAAIPLAVITRKRRADSRH